MCQKTGCGVVVGSRQIVCVQASWGTMRWRRWLMGWGGQSGCRWSVCGICLCGRRIVDRGRWCRSTHSFRVCQSRGFQSRVHSYCVCKSRVSISWVSMHLVCTRIVCVNLVRTHFERSNLVCGRIPCVLSVNLVSTCIVNVEKVWYKITSESLI